MGPGAAEGSPKNQDFKLRQEPHAEGHARRAPLRWAGWQAAHPQRRVLAGLLGAQTLGPGHPQPTSRAHSRASWSRV